MHSPALLSRLVGFPTVSDRPNQDLIAFAADLLTAAGAVVSRQTYAPGKDNLFARIGPDTPGGVMMAGHIDVVPTSGQNWSSDPFTMREGDGRLFGRGTCDMKGFVASVLSVATGLDRAQLKRPLYIALTGDEEVNMAGARALLSFVQDKANAPAWIWLGEPTDFSVVSAHKGMNCVETHIDGAPGHSGLPHKGLSAVHMAMDIGAWILARARDCAHKPITGSPFDPPYTSFNIGVVQGGNADNVIAAQATLLWELRPHPGDDPKTFWTAFDQFVDSELRPRLAAFPGTRIDTRITSETPSLSPSDDNPGVDLLTRLLDVPAPVAVSYATEGGWYQGLCPHVVVCGPGSIRQAHKADEYIPRTDLDRCDDLIARVVAAYLC